MNHSVGSSDCLISIQLTDIKEKPLHRTWLDQGQRDYYDITCQETDWSAWQTMRWPAARMETCFTELLDHGVSSFIDLKVRCPTMNVCSRAQRGTLIGVYLQGGVP